MLLCTLGAAFSHAQQSRIADDMVEISLEAHTVYGSPTIGYQMLIDKDHTAYGSLFFDTSYYLFAGYTDFEYTVPAIDYITIEDVVVEGKETITIPAGVYDLVVIRPDAEGKNIIGGLSRLDDFEFIGGNSYTFKVEMIPNEFGYNTDGVILETNYDLAVTSLTLPENGLDLGAAEDITVEITNKGLNVVSEFDVYYSVDGGEKVVETITEAIEPGAAYSYTFSKKADFSNIQTYEVTAGVELTEDLVSMNNTLSGKCKHSGVMNTPFFEDFATADNFNADWIVIKAEGRYDSWQHQSWWASPDGTMGAVSCSTYDDMSDDYMITPGIHLEKGANHLTFYSHSSVADAIELLDIRLGQSNAVADMTMIADFVVEGDQYRYKVVNFEVAESGTYYIAFHAKSREGTCLIVDDVLVDAGEIETTPALEIKKVLLPLSSCNLSEESKVGVRLTNTGTAATKSFSLTYSVNGGNPVPEVFNEALGVDQTADYYFATTADFSAVGTYEVLVSVACDNIDNDEITATIKNLPSINTYPFTTNFYLNEGIEDYWIQNTEGTWAWDSFGTCYTTNVSGEENCLVSRCFNIMRPIRVKLEYGGGNTYSPSSFYLAYGEPGSTPEEWIKIHENTNITGSSVAEVDIAPEAWGDYCLYVVSTAPDYTSLSLYRLTVSEIFDYDIRVRGVNSPLVAYMPKNHLTKDLDFTVEVENRGLQTMAEINAKLMNGSEVISTSTTPIELQNKGIGTITLTGNISKLISGQPLTLSMTVAGATEDGYKTDNTYIFPTINATDTIFATEGLVTIGDKGTGQSGTPCGFGNVFTLMETDTISSITIGLAEASWYSDPIEIGAALYSLKEDGKTIDQQLFVKTFERLAGGDLRVIKLTPRILPAGKYYVEAQQLTWNNIGVAYEENENGVFYQNVDNVLQPMTGANIAVRANFASGVVAYENNVSVTAITAPVFKSDLFTSEETISATVENLGCNDHTGLEVRCSSNGVEISQKIDLPAYGSANVDFYPVDMSEAGTYEIKVYTVLANDENTADDSCVAIYTAAIEGDPYTLDFELCNDFESGTQFNPRWWTVDRNNYSVDGFWMYDYPCRYEPVGFMAFNIAATTPALTVSGVEPHSGDRFGAAFATNKVDPATYSNVDSDVWLISPKLSLNGNSSLELYVRTKDFETADQEMERYEILISETDDNFYSFERIGEERRAPTEWTLVTEDLGEYDNKDVYVAIRYVSRVIKGMLLMVDDIKVITDTTTGVEDIIGGKFSVIYRSDIECIDVNAPSAINAIGIYSVTGQLMQSANNLNGTTSYRMPVENYAAGIYIAIVSTETGNKSIKFVVK